MSEGLSLPPPLLPSSVGAPSVEGVSCEVMLGHWRAPRATHQLLCGSSVTLPVPPSHVSGTSRTWLHLQG